MRNSKALVGMDVEDAKRFVGACLFNSLKGGIDTSALKEYGLHKPINPALECFVGVHELEMKALPTWWNEFKQKYAYSVIGELREDIAEAVNEEIKNGTAELKETRLILDLREQMKTITVENFKAGTYPNGRKILKYMVTIAEQVRKKDEYEKSDWFLFFVKSNANNGAISVVITPSIASHLACSNVFDKPGMSSCQRFEGFGTRSKIPQAHWGNIANPDGLLVYVTAGRMDTLAGSQLTHQTMIARTHLRLFKKDKASICSVCKGNLESGNIKTCCLDSKNHTHGKDEYCLAMDRFYTQDTYFRDVFLTIKDIAEKNGMELMVFDGYSKSKDSSSNNYKMTTGKKVIGVSPSGIQLINSSNTNCEYCENYNTSKCPKFERCKYYATCSALTKDIKKECSNCLIVRSDCESPILYYSDNNMSSFHSVVDKSRTFIRSSLLQVTAIS